MLTYARLHGIIHGDGVHSEERLKHYLMLCDKLRLAYWGGPLHPPQRVGRNFFLIIWCGEGDLNPHGVTR